VSEANEVAAFYLALPETSLAEEAAQQGNEADRP